MQNNPEVTAALKEVCALAQKLLRQPNLIDGLPSWALEHDPENAPLFLMDAYFDLSATLRAFKGDDLCAYLMGLPKAELRNAESTLFAIWPTLKAASVFV